MDSDAKALKEQSMHDQACRRYEEGLEAIRTGITKKGGTKLRDAVNARLGRLYKQYGAIRKEYDVTLRKSKIHGVPKTTSKKSPS